MSTFVPILLVLFVVLMEKRNREVQLRRILSKRKEKLAMEELAKRFIGQDCIVYTFSGSNYTGIIREVGNGAVILDNGHGNELVNLEYVIRIREYPKGKNGKRKIFSVG